MANQNNVTVPPATLERSDASSSIFKDYILKVSDNDRIKLEINGEYVTYLRIIDGKLSYLSIDDIEVI